MDRDGLAAHAPTFTLTAASLSSCCSCSTPLLADTRTRPSDGQYARLQAATTRGSSPRSSPTPARPLSTRSTRARSPSKGLIRFEDQPVLVEDLRIERAAARSNSGARSGSKPSSPPRSICGSGSPTCSCARRINTSNPPRISKRRAPSTAPGSKVNSRSSEGRSSKS